MAFAKKPYKPKRNVPRPTTATFPSLHEDIKKALENDTISPEPWFNSAGGDHDANEIYETYIMGRFECRNGNCLQSGWSSKKIPILIRRFHDNGYNAVVFKQRCKSCKRLGVMRLDENSYVERITYRLKRWAGVPTEQPIYNVGSRGPHETDLCEGCRAGHCERGRF